MRRNWKRRRIYQYSKSYIQRRQHCVYPSDYTSLDEVHGLTWKTCAQGRSGADCSGGAITAISWNDATAGLPGSCSELNTFNGGNGYAGKTNWRIPNVRELASLIHASNVPKIETLQFPNTNAAVTYLSNTTCATAPANAEYK
ncbi:PF07603 family protein [Leptospira weilii serovar Ranarum str. ICFT]|uniref:PF07603 family protein n=1 Tax=Leptospira weilii serovar Ranarum str. ICFT TaxID=1218598 RepID=N1WS80_9LEPT|nr:PF07603 family protein [Leptospira weilii serovar Ranarum str. ICFT]